jgi:hypothetical protein
VWTVGGCGFLKKHSVYQTKHRESTAGGLIDDILEIPVRNSKAV